MNFHDSTSPVLSLSVIRSTLIRLEDTIIFSLIERAQFAKNSKMYQDVYAPEAQNVDAVPNGKRTGAGLVEFKEVLEKERKERGEEIANENAPKSWLDWFIKEQEASHAKVRRYQSPDEHPFTHPSLLPSPVLPPLPYPKILHPPAANRLNVNSQIKKLYVEEVIPGVCTKGLGGIEGDDGNYGSAATKDVEVLQALSRRIHVGMFVSESKFRDKPNDFIPHIPRPTPGGTAPAPTPEQIEGLTALIYKPEVEAQLLKRLEKKAAIYGSDLNGSLPSTIPDASQSGKIDVKEVVRLYRDWVIPLTKDVEVEYLVHRLDGLTDEEVEQLKK